MKKTYAVLLGALFSFIPLSAQSFELFSDDVPRYEGFAAGIFGLNQYALPMGGWGDYAVANAGGGFGLEYTLPAFLPGNIDLGLSLNAQVSYTFPKKDSTLKSHNDLRTYAGFFFRVPFVLGGQYFAFQPEIGYGADLNYITAHNGSNAKGLYIDHLITFTPSLRFIPKAQALSTLEFELSPYWSYSPEADNNAVNNVGARIGIIWHIQSYLKTRKLRAEEKRLTALRAQQEAEARRLEEEKALHEAEIERLRREAEAAAADEAEKARLEEELRKAQEAARAAEEARLAAEEEARRLEEEARKAEEARIAEENLRAQMREELKLVLKNPEYFLGLESENLNDFTPDGDGVNDTITFRPTTKFLSNPPASWSLVITDPKGGLFKSWSGEGYPPEIIWDGRGNDDSVVFSRETYMAKLNVTLSEIDRERLGRSTLQASVEGSVNIKNGIILNSTGENEWRIEMTSITFDSNAATFKKLSKAQLEEFLRSLDELAEKMLSIKGAKVTVEGYANNVSGTEKEDKEELIPLSQIRAEAIAKMLVERGIAEDDISAVGMGGANPKASREDKANWWKNRRIEFVIRK